MRAGTEINPWGPIVLQAGTLYDGATGWQPRLGLRVQILRQARHAIDIAIGAQYDGASYENKPGFETFIALSRQFGRLGLFANLVYGQELEPSQRHGDVRLAALGRVAGSFYLGLDSRAAFDLDSGREQLEDDERDVDFVLSAGPTASWSVKLFSLLLQGGASATRYKGSSVQAGGFALVGFGVTLF
jgi:hypothetical protein